MSVKQMALRRMVASSMETVQMAMMMVINNAFTLSAILSVLSQKL
jgi:hypothetical protein